MDLSESRSFEFQDILHYQKIIVALTETDRVMRRINEIDIEDPLKKLNP